MPVLALHSEIFMKRFFLLLVVIVLGKTVSFAVLPLHFEKAFLKELQNKSKLTNEVFQPLVVPEKFKLNGWYMQFKVDSKVKYGYAGKVFTHRSQANATSTNEYIEYVIFFDTLFTIQKVKVISITANNGIGVSAPNWLKQFIGFKPGSYLQVGKEIDGISGATNTVNSFTFDIQSKTNILKEICRN